MRKLLFFLLFITGMANSQIVNIPDANFKAKLLQANSSNSIGGGLTIDTNSDGEIDQSEALAVSYLNVENSGISDLTGLEFFTNLTYFGCTYNQITSLDVTSLVNLHWLYCQNNSSLQSINASGLTTLQTFYFFQNPQLTTVNASNCSGLTEFNYNSGNLTSINVSGCSSLSVINLEHNHFTSIDVSGLTSLHYLYVSGNQLNSINVTGCNNLIAIECMNNQLTTLDFHDLPSLGAIRATGNLITQLNMIGLPNLQDLQCVNNPLQIIDVSHLPNLTGLSFGSAVPIEWLNMKNGVVTNISLSTPSTIHNACIDESEFNQFEGPFVLTNPPTTYCTFTPGGNYNTITGTITFDENNNGCDLSDAPKPFVLINLNDGTATPKHTFTNLNGAFNFYTLTGNFIVTPQIENLTWFVFTPSSATIPLSTLNNSVTQNFCLSPLGVHNDVEVVIVPIGGARPGFDATYKMIYKNKGTQTLSGTLNFAYDDTRLDFVSSTTNPDVQTLGNLTWNYSNLMPFESRSITITLNVNSPIETPAVNIGDFLDFAATINPISGDDLPLDNEFGLKQIVVGSYDPNDKVCLEGDVVSPTKIGDYLHYNINFENTGTFQAENIVVKDMIDTAKFDINTLQILHSSHPMTTRITGNKVEFIFENINLAASEHGNVAFKIKTKSTLVAGNTVTNNANIYFDYNAPVVTNTASTTFQTLSATEFTADASVAIYPNPAKNNVNVTCDSAIKSIQLFDVQGRILETQLVNQTQTDLDVSKYSNGVYFIKVITEKGIKAQKLIKN